ncbi:MAG TPA: hypothetical protein VE261_02435 [Gaiellaceae bacterium]|nr:hypothetical protein [Gaiellaceae bacterium]
MHALTTGHGWGALVMTLAILGWSTLMLLLVYLLTRLWHTPPTTHTTRSRRHPSRR